MNIAQSFAEAYSPSFFAESFLEKANIPQLEFVQVEMPEAYLATEEPSWFESVATELIHIPEQDLDIWVGVEEDAAPSYQEWWVCVNNRGEENPKKDVDLCLEPHQRNFYTLSCENKFNETSLSFEAVCDYCVTRHDADEEEEPVCTTPCNYSVSYLDEFNQEVFDVRCIDPFYAIALENRYVPTAPPALRIIFQIIAALMELHVVAIAIAPWYLILVVYQLVDFLLDWVFYGIFFAWCLPCAWVFIWLLNIAFLPIQVWGYVNRF
jgi:hypothetical protein